MLGDTPSQPRTGGKFCTDCRGVRLHTVRRLKSGDGKVTRDLVCSACEKVSRLGLCCPKCGECRLKVDWTRHRVGVTDRVKSCRSCGHRIRTREVVSG